MNRTYRSILLATGATALATTTALSLAAPAAAVPKSPTTPPSSRLHEASVSQTRDTLAALARHRDSVELVAGVTRGTSLTRVADAAEQGPGTVSHVLTPLRRVSVRVPKADAAAAAARLRSTPGVATVATAAQRYLYDVPNDPRYASAQAPYLSEINAPAAWSRTHGGADITIAVIDTGVDVGHEDLGSKVVTTYNAVTETQGNSAVADDVGHGTFVAGVAAAATNNGLGVAGVGWNTSIMAIKVDQPEAADPFYSISSVDEARGITWAVDHGADIVNISLGSPEPDSTEAAAVAYARSKGVLVVAAAGNEHTDAKSYPAADDGVVAVGATDADGGRANFSNYGSWVTLAAPGVDITSTTPRQKSRLFSTNYDAGQGTSFSSPLAAGAAALLLASHPNATPDQLTTALTDSAEAKPGLGLGAGELDVAGALSALVPASTPAAPTVTGTSGTITLSVASDAPRVRFSVDGTALPTVATTDGTATTTLSTYGYSNASHDIRAAACSTTDACAANGPATGVTLANEAPVLNSPVSGEEISGAFAMTATATGGGVAFRIDGEQVAFDGTAPYAVNYSGSALTEGSHEITVAQCDTAGTRCSGPASDPVTVQTASLHPTIVSLSPSPFSPNGDKVKDTTTLTYSLPDTETVSVSVRNSAGTTVRSATSLGTLAKGTHTWVWNGRGNSNATLPGGAYTVVLETSSTDGDVTLRGQVSRGVVQDITLPLLGSLTGSGTTFYPYHDGFRDLFTPTAKLSEKASVYLKIFNSTKVLLRSIRVDKPAGTVAPSWDGTNSSGKALGAGRYLWQLVAIDGAGNQRGTGVYSVNLSTKRYVTRTATYVTNAGAESVDYRTTDPSCTGLASSAYSHGVTLINHCEYDPDDAESFQLIEGVFRFTLPSATKYVSLSASAIGLTDYPTSQIASVFTGVGSQDDTVGDIVNVTSATSRRYSLGSIPAAGFVTSKHVAELALALGNFYNTNKTNSDIDLGSITLTVKYQVLV